MLPVRQPSQLNDLRAFLGDGHRLENLQDLHYSPPVTGTGFMRLIKLILHALCPNSYYETQSFNKRADLRKDMAKLHEELRNFAQKPLEPRAFLLSDKREYRLVQVIAPLGDMTFAIKLAGSGDSLSFRGAPKDLITAIHRHVLKNVVSYANDDSRAKTRSAAHALIKEALFDTAIPKADRQAAMDLLESCPRRSYATELLSILQKEYPHQFGIRLNRYQPELAGIISSEILKIDFTKTDDYQSKLAHSAEALAKLSCEDRGKVLNAVKLKLPRTLDEAVQQSCLSYLNIQAVKLQIISCIARTPASEFGKSRFHNTLFKNLCTLTAAQRKSLEHALRPNLERFDNLARIFSLAMGNANRLRPDRQEIGDRPWLWLEEFGYVRPPGVSANKFAGI